LPIVNLNISDLVTMPYQDRRWLYDLPFHLARLIGDGSVTSYNVFLYACHTATSVLVYFVVRVLFPDRPGWALLAGLLKLVYPASNDVYSSATLSQEWGECVMLLAVLCLAIVLSRDRLRSSTRAVLLAVTFLAVMFPVGIYESTWPLVLLTPPLLVLTVGLRDGGSWRAIARRAVRPVVVWYAGAIASMAVFIGRLVLSPTLSTSADGYVSARDPAVWLGRVAQGTETVLVGSLAVPLRHLFDFTLARAGLEPTTAGQYVPLASAKSLAVLLVVGLGIVAVVCWRRRTLRAPSFAGRTVLALGVGFGLIVVALLPPTLSGDPVFGTRFLQFASYGTIVVLISLAYAAERMLHRPVLVASVAAAVVVLWGFYVDSVGNYYGEVGRQSRRFFYQLRTELPSVQEGTVVLLLDSPHSGDVYEHVTTMILRSFTGTHTSYLLSDAVVKIQDDPSQPFVRLTTCTNLDDGPDPKFERGYWAMPPCVLDPEKYSASVHTSDIPRDRIVWLRWDAPSQMLHIEEQRSAMQRIDGDAHSDFGSLLFPDEPTASGTH
jgi:hypothetical protein